MAELTTQEEKLAEETERRCTEVAGGRDGKKTAILGKVNEKAGDEELRELVDWALPIQERHLQQVREGSLRLAAEEDPYEA